MAKEIVLEDEQDERDAETEAAFAELAGSGEMRWTIYCTGPRDKVGHCATWEDGMSLDRIAREYGAGTYKVRAIGSDGKMVKGGGRTITISNNSAYEREKQKAAALASVPTVARSDMSVADIIGLITAQQSQSQAALQAQQAQMMQMMQLTMKSQGDFMMAMMAKPGPQALGAPEIISMMAGIKEMVGPSDGGGVDTLLKGLELGRSLDGGGSGDGMDFLSVAAKGLDVISSAVKANPRPQSLPVKKPTRRVEVKQTVSKSVSPKVTEPVVEDPMLKKLNWLKMQVAALLVQAQRQSDPALYAAVFLDNLPDLISEGEVHERFSAEGAVAQLELLDGRVSQFKPWFEEFRAAVLEQMEEDETDEADEADEGQFDAGHSED